MGTKEITIEIKRPVIIILLVLLSIILILELQVTFPSPIVFGDEGFHTGMARYISDQKDYPVWQPFEGETKLLKIGFKRPPLWNLSEGGFYLIFGFNEAIVKFLTPFIAVILTGLSVFLLGKKIYDENVGFFTAIITVTIPSFVTYSVLFYTDAMFVFYLSMFILTFFLSIKTGNKKYWFLSGIFAGFSFLTKTPGFVVFPLIGLGFLYQIYKQKGIVSLLKNYSILVLFLFLIIGPFFLRNYVYYNTPSCDLPFLNTDGCSVTFDYENRVEMAGELEQTGTAVNIFEMGVLNYFNFAYGNIWFVVFGFISGLIIIFSRKKESDILIILVILSFLPIIYLGSGGRSEDAARYTLGLVPIIALSGGIYLTMIYNFVKKYQKYLAMIIFIFIIVYSLFGSRFLDIRGNGEFRGNGIIDKLFGYDVVQNNQLVHISGLKDIKQFSPSFLEACDFIKKNVNEDASIMTIWIHHSSYNCERNIAGFHNLPDLSDIVLSSDLNLAVSRLEAHGITHIFIQKFSLSSDSVAEKYPISFVQFLENNPDNFEKIYENGPALEQCLQAGGCDGNILYEVKY